MSNTLTRPTRRLCVALATTSLLAVASGSAAASDQQDVILGVPPWGGVEVKSQVVTKILEPLGFNVEQTSAGAPIVYEGLGKGDIHVNMSAWAPGQAPTFMPHVEAGDVVRLGENLEGAVAGFAVPQYVYDSGITHARDLQENAERFDSTVFCIDTGSGANSVVNEAIDNDVYGLGDWSIVPSSTAGMLSRVGRAVNDEEPIVFCGWRPHWMNVRYDMRYLQDPEDLWGPNGGESTVYTLATDSFQETHPHLTTFFERFVIDAQVQSQWLFETGQQDRSLDTVATEWIAANLDTIEPWVEGLETPNGQDPMTALREAY